jgi:starvation-inducible outer membrane lipoprotein
MNRNAAALLFPSLLLSACAGMSSQVPTRNAEAAYTLREVDSAPQQLGCADYAAPSVYREEVNLEYVVDASGAVEPGSIRLAPAQPDATGLRRGPNQPSEVARKKAWKAAQNCRYTPAKVGGQAVRAQVRERFTF